jgi:hypothetical protein
MVRVYCLGNKYISEDSIALLFIDQTIGSFEFQEYHQEVKGDIVIMDVCKGIDEMQILDFDKFLERHPVSAHDFDIGMELKLLQATGQVDKVKVIAIPFGWNYDQVLAGLNSF